MSNKETGGRLLKVVDVIGIETENVKGNATVIVSEATPIDTAIGRGSANAAIESLVEVVDACKVSEIGSGIIRSMQAVVEVTAVEAKEITTVVAGLAKQDSQTTAVVAGDIKTITAEEEAGLEESTPAGRGNHRRVAAEPAEATSRRKAGIIRVAAGVATVELLAAAREIGAVVAVDQQLVIDIDDVT